MDLKEQLSSAVAAVEAEANLLKALEKLFGLIRVHNFKKWLDGKVLTGIRSTILLFAHYRAGNPNPLKLGNGEENFNLPGRFLIPVSKFRSALNCDSMSQVPGHNSESKNNELALPNLELSGFRRRTAGKNLRQKKLRLYRGNWILS